MKTVIRFFLACLTICYFANGVAIENGVRQGSGAGTFCWVAAGSPNVNLVGKPIARVGDPILCVEGIVCPDEISQVFGTISIGSSSVRINGTPAAVSGISVVETCIGTLPLAGWPFVDIAP